MNSDTLNLVAALGSWVLEPGPIYLRLANGLTRAIDDGLIGAARCYTPERPLAEQLAVSRTTVIGAYYLLRERLVESRRGSGTRVRASSGHRFADVENRPIEPLGEAQLPGVFLGRPVHIIDTVDLTAAAPAALARLVADELVASAAEMAPLLAQHGYIPVACPPCG